VSEPKPKTPRELARWRLETQCRLGTNALNKESERIETTPLHYAVYCLLKAVEEIPTLLAKEAERE